MMQKSLLFLERATKSTLSGRMQLLKHHLEHLSARSYLSAPHPEQISSFQRQRIAFRGLWQPLTRFTHGASRHGHRTYFNQSWGRRRRFIPDIPEDTALYGLLAANVAVFFLWRSNPVLGMRHFTTSIDNIKAGRLHTLVTCAFSQNDFWHLVSNGVGLYFFGRNCAYVLGGGGLVVLYLVGGVVGSMVYVAGQALESKEESRDPFDWYYGAKQQSSATPALGSSGAVSSIVIFDILMAPTATVLIYGIFPVHAWILGGLFLYTDISGALGRGRQNIGYTVHLAGSAIGALAFLGVRRGKIPIQGRRW